MYVWVTHFPFILFSFLTHCFTHCAILSQLNIYRNILFMDSLLASCCVLSCPLPCHVLLAEPPLIFSDYKGVPRTHIHMYIKTKGTASLLAWMFVLVLLVLVIWEETPRSPISVAECWDPSQPDQHRYTHSHALHSCLHTHVLYTRLQLLVP